MVPSGGLAEHIPPDGEQQRRPTQIAQPAGGGDDRRAPGLRPPLEPPAAGDDVAVADGAGVLVEQLHGAEKRQQARCTRHSADRPRQMVGPTPRRMPQIRTPTSSAAQRVAQLVEQQRDPGARDSGQSRCSPACPRMAPNNGPISITCACIRSNLRRPVGASRSTLNLGAPTRIHRNPIRAGLPGSNSHRVTSTSGTSSRTIDSGWNVARSPR